MRTKDGYPKITVVTPSYNQAQFLERTILSVLNQNYPNLEYIIIDGGSTDGSIEIIKKYESKLAYWESEPDRGQSHAINKGWQRATGEIVAWLNSDDTYEPDAIQKVMLFMQKNPEVDMIYGNCFLIDEDGQIISPFWHNDQLINIRQMINDHRLCLPQQTVFIRKNTLNRVGLLDENLHYKMDRDLYIRIRLNGNVAMIQEHLANFRCHKRAKSTPKNAVKAWQEFLLIRKRYGGNVQFHSDLQFWKSYFTTTVKDTIQKVPVLCNLLPKAYHMFKDNINNAIS